MNGIKKWFDVRTFFLTLFPFAILFCFVPVELYFNNLREWGGDYYLLLFFAGMGLLLSILVYTGLHAAGMIFNVKTIPIAYWLFILGVYFIVSDIFSPLQLGFLDGSNVSSKEPILYTLIELFLLVLCFWGGRCWSGKDYKGWCVGFSIATVLILGGYLAYCVQHSKNAFAHFLDTKDAGHGNASNSRPNVYHIVLDAMQTDFLLELMHRSDYENILQGFYLFENNIANYPYTSPSSSSYLSGTVYTGDSYAKWTSEHEDGLFNLADKAGYAVSVYGKPSVIHAAAARSYVRPDTVLKSNSGIRHPLLKEFIRLWVARVSPNFLTNEALDYGAKLGDRICSLVDKPTGAFQPKTIGDGIEPFSGALMLKEVIKTEKSRPSHNSYLYAHPILPHGPYVLDEKCNYLKDRGLNFANNCIEQTACAINLLSEFIDELRLLGRYDNSIMVVHSDHGSGWESDGFYRPGSKTPDKAPFREQIGFWSKHHLEARSMAFLMIKPPFSNSTFQIVDAKSQLMDIYPTILDYAGIPCDHLDSGAISLKECIAEKACEEINTRDRYFYLFPPAGPLDGVVEKLKVNINDFGQPEFMDTEKVEIAPSLLDIGHHVSFGRKSDGEKYLRYGWSGSEASYIWSNKERARLNFRLSKKVNTPLVIKLNAWGFPALGRDPQNISVYANETKIGSWQVLELAWYEVTVPKEMIINDTVDITFEIGKPTAPCEISDSKDCRKLGIALKELVVEPNRGDP